MGKNIYPLQKPESLAVGVMGLASPKSRLASGLLDLVILLPLIQLFQAPVKRIVIETFLLGENPDVWFYRNLNLGIFILTFIFYHSLMTYWKGQTFGKMLFKIKVISYNGHLTLFNCFSRSCTMVLGFFLLGYPFLALFSHPLRRPFHDRLSDSLVIALESPISPPGFSEKWKSRLMANSLLMFVIVLGFNSDFNNYFNFKNRKTTDSLFSQERNCETMEKQKGSDPETFLQLYLTHQVDKACLLKVAGNGIWMKGKQNSVAKFSMVFVFGDDLRKSNQYLKELCSGEPKGSLCSFSRWLLGLKKIDPQSLDQLYNMTNEPDFNDSLRVISAGFFRMGGQFERVSSVLEPLQSNEILQPLVAGFLFHSLLGQRKWSEAYWVYRSQASIDSLDILKFLDMENKNKNKTFDRTDQIALFEFFFPQLKDYGETKRRVSSLGTFNEELVEAYRTLLDHP